MLPKFHQQYPISFLLHVYLEPIPHYLYNLQNIFSDFPTENFQNYSHFTYTHPLTVLTTVSLVSEGLSDQSLRSKENENGWQRKSTEVQLNVLTNQLIFEDEDKEISTQKCRSHKPIFPRTGRPKLMLVFCLFVFLSGYLLGNRTEVCIGCHWQTDAQRNYVHPVTQDCDSWWEPRENNFIYIYIIFYIYIYIYQYGI